MIGFYGLILAIGLALIVCAIREIAWLSRFGAEPEDIEIARGARPPRADLTRAIARMRRRAP